MNIESLKKDFRGKVAEKPLAPTYVALLLILSEGPAHAWRIKNVLDDRGFEEWVDMKKSTIYKSLGMLEKKGLIRGEREEEDLRLSRKTYEITESGGKVLREQIQLCLENPSKPKNMFDLGLAGLSLLTKSAALSSLEAYKKRLEHSIEWFESIFNQLDNLKEIAKTDPKHIVAGMPARELEGDGRLYIVRALFERPYHSVSAQKYWLEGFIQSIRDDEGRFEFREE